MWPHPCFHIAFRYALPTRSSFCSGLTWFHLIQWEPICPLTKQNRLKQNENEGDVHASSFKKRGYVYRLMRYGEKFGNKTQNGLQRTRDSSWNPVLAPNWGPKDEWGSINDNLGQCIDRRSNVKSELFNSINFPLCCLLCWFARFLNEFCGIPPFNCSPLESNDHQFPKVDRRWYGDGFARKAKN